MENMKKEYVKEFKLLTQMVSEGVSNDVVKDQAKKVFDMGERIISELEDEQHVFKKKQRGGQSKDWQKKSIIG